MVFGLTNNINDSMNIFLLRKKSEVSFHLKIIHRQNKK